MCIICKIKQAGISEEALELVEALAEFTVEVSNGLNRLQAEGAKLAEEERLALLGVATMFGQGPGEDEPAPEGVPAEIWAVLPANLRQIMQAAITNGAKLQVVSLSDMMPDESITKH